MGSSWKFGRIAGIPIYVHWTFLILIAYLVFGHWQAGHDVATTMEGIAFVMSLFGCVVLHELGHALAARQFGVPTADITLLPIGGVARLQRIPEHPGQELVIALAGPAVNVAIVAILYLIGIRPFLDTDDPQLLVNARFLPKLMLVNVFLFAFNMLPAFPMDGGRVLRALLALRLPYAQATRLAASVGQFMAIGFGVMGLLGNPMLILIALFVWIGAESEAAQAQERLVLSDVSVRDAMLTDYRTLEADATLGQAADLLLAGSQHDFPVLSEGRPVGLLARSDLLSGLSRAGPASPVAEHQRPGIGSVEATTPLVPALARLREGEGPCLLVVEAGRPVGLLNLENIGEYLMVRAALAAPDGDDGPRPPVLRGVT